MNKFFYNCKDCFLLRLPFTNNWHRYKKWWKAEESELPEELKEELSQFIKDFKKGVNNEH